MDSSYDQGGYDCRFVDENIEKFTCNICTKVSRDPHITGCCGQHFCESCLNYWFTSGSNHRKESCPHCRAEGKQFQHFLNKCIKREIDSLKIDCPNSEEGCQWVGELGSLKDHLEPDNGCGYVEVECPNECLDFTKRSPSNSKSSPLKLKRKELDSHLKDKCFFRSYQCVHCGYEDKHVYITGCIGGVRVLKNYNCHYDECPEFPLECPNKCGVKDIKRMDMEDHRSQCPEEPVQCPFEEAGCKEKLVRRELEQHVSAMKQVVQHQQMLMAAYKEVKQELMETKEELQQVKQEQSRKRRRFEHSDAWF